MKVYKISVVTLIIKNMVRSFKFYSQIPGFKLVYGGSPRDSFATFEIGEGTPKMYLNLELTTTNSNSEDSRKHLGRLNEDRFTKHFCNRCRKEYSNSPVIIYENPNEELSGEGLILVEKWEYKYRVCSNIIAIYSKFK